MPREDRSARNSAACLGAEQERRASNLLWMRNVRVSAAEIACWQLGPNLIENQSRRSRRLPGAN
jgi:hypothetical protein